MGLALLAGGLATHLYDYAGNVMDAVGLDKLGGGPDSYTNWFRGCMAGCGSVQTLELYRYDEAEMTGRGTSWCSSPGS